MKKDRTVYCLGLSFFSKILSLNSFILSRVDKILVWGFIGSRLKLLSSKQSDSEASFSTDELKLLLVGFDFGSIQLIN